MAKSFFRSLTISRVSIGRKSQRSTMIKSLPKSGYVRSTLGSSLRVLQSDTASCASCAYPLAQLIRSISNRLKSAYPLLRIFWGERKGWEPKESKEQQRTGTYRLKTKTGGRAQLENRRNEAASIVMTKWEHTTAARDNKRLHSLLLKNSKGSALLEIRSRKLPVAQHRQPFRMQIG